MPTEFTLTNKQLFRSMRNEGVSKKKAGRVLAALNKSSAAESSRGAHPKRRAKALGRKVKRLRTHSKPN
jgi:hypothetical protein